MTTARPKAALSVAVRFGVSVALLLVIARLADLGEIARRLRDLSPVWVALGLAISLPQMALLGWRWRFTAARLGIDLPLGVAIREYYLGLFFNQTLPGAVLGDASRAWRHARTDVPTGAAVRAVVFERASAQVIMTTVALVCVLTLPIGPLPARIGVVILTGFVVAAFLRYALGRSVTGALVSGMGGDVHRALLARDAFPLQAASGLLAVASYICVYLVAARAVGVDTSTAQLAPLVAPVLMTMLIPVSVAGWGVREGAAGVLWAMVGLTPEDGVAISIAYGLLALLSSAPGTIVLLTSPPAGRGRTTRPGPAERDDTPDGEPPRGPSPDRG